MPTLVFLKPITDTGLKIFSGSVKVNVPGADMSHAVRLLRMPKVTITNEADKSRATSTASGNPEFFHVTCETIIDKSTVHAFNCVTSGSNIGDVAIYQMTTGAGEMKILSEIVLSNTFITEVSIAFDVSRDAATSEGLIASYVMVYDKLTQVRHVFDEKDQGVGKFGSELNRDKQISEVGG